MIWLRKGVVHLLSLILFIALVGGVWALSLNLNFSKPDRLKTWLTESKVYDKAITAALDGAQQDQQKNGGDNSVSLKDPAVQSAAKGAFSPHLLQTSANAFIDANYAWLQGKTPTPKFNIDLSGAKADFATKVGKHVETRLTGLAVCTPEQQAQLQIPIDSFTVTCRPAGLDPKTEGDRVRDQINNSGDFLSQPVLTANTLGQNKPDRGDQPPSQPYYAKLSDAPKFYRLGQKLPLILGVLALLTALGIIVVAPLRRRGWRRVGFVLAEAGIILVATKFVADALVRNIERKALTGSTAAQLQDIRDDLAHRIETQLFQVNLWFGLAFLVLAIVIFVYLIRARHAGQPKPPKTPSVPTETPPPSEDARPLTPPVKTADQMPPLKHPPKPKRPRLIQ